MAAKIVGHVWDLELPAPQRLVLLAMADHADHEGKNVYPSIGLIAWKTGYSERQVKRIIKALVSSGILELVKSPRGKVRHYHIHLDKGVTKQPFQRGDNMSQGSDKMTQGGDIAMSPEPLLKEVTKQVQPPARKEISQQQRDLVLDNAKKLMGENNQWLNNIDWDRLDRAMQEYPIPDILEAIRETKARGKTSVAYAMTILQNKARETKTPAPSEWHTALYDQWKVNPPPEVVPELTPEQRAANKAISDAFRMSDVGRSLGLDKRLSK